MNANIKYAFFQALKQDTPQECLEAEAKAIVEVNNESAAYGFTNMQQLKFCEAEITEVGANIVVQPQSGMMSIHDLFLLKEAWGADDLFVYKEGIELQYK